MRHAGLLRLTLILLFSVAIFWSQNIYAQERTVSGKVISFEDDEPLPGVNVKIKGTGAGTVTDINGEFSISVAESDVLVFSFIGFTKEEVSVGSRSVIDVTLAPDIKSLSEVVVIGYGTQRKSDITGSLTQVTSENFNPGQVTNPEQLITGKVAGVSITPGSGRPGAGARIRIRGGSSLNANNDPLIVIDGVPVDQRGISGTANPLNFLNPADIETFDILKDASATAIYGSRASNGVILITTKKGKIGDEIRANVSTLVSVSQPFRFVDVLDADTYRGLVEEQAPNRVNLLGDSNTNWQDEIYRNAVSFDNNATVSGSLLNGNLPFRASAGYLNQQGVLDTDQLDRYTASFNISPSLLNDDLRFDINLKAARTESRFAPQGAIGSAAIFDPTQSVRGGPENLGGFFEWVDGSGNPQPLAPNNPVGIIAAQNDRGQVMRSIGNLKTDYSVPFLPGLTATVNAGFDISQSQGTNRTLPNSANGFVVGGSFSEFEQLNRNLLLDVYFNYVRDFGKLGRLDFTAGYSWQDFYQENPGFPVVSIEDLQADGTPVEISAAPNETRPQFRLISYFGRMNYNISDKYLFTGTVRADGSSRFAPENRWGIFPSGAFAWRVKQEGFLQDVEALSDLKFRVGYGVTGQQEIGAVLPFLPTYTISDNNAMYRLGDNFFNTLRPEGYDRDIRWESTVQLNLGVDFSLFNDKLSGTIDVFSNETRDLLAFAPVPAGANLTNFITTNIGNIRNQGIEIALNYNMINTPDLNWDFGVNTTFNRVEVLNIPVDEGSPGILVGGIQGGTGNTVQVHSEGFWPATFFLWQQVYGPDGRPLEGVYVDQTGSGSISEADLRRSVNPDPQMFYGIINTVDYKKWRFEMTLRGNMNNFVYNNINSTNGNFASIRFPGYMMNMTSDVLNTGFQQQRFLSDYYLENASFLRAENISIGYNAGEIFSGVNLSLNANVQNAFVLTGYSGVDPEIPGGIDNNFYPFPRIWSLGVNFGF
ncbi:MAG: TonB-dependent receptor [Cyclobacteriaceae bacterium]|nr:TonB-dependent receptor [Cyclobacteriaceae bacterium]MCH8517506.1 TonB-dependent receptor [Cyclobacteriaceae bacterium]